MALGKCILFAPAAEMDSVAAGENREVIEMAEFRAYPFFIRGAVWKYLKKEYGGSEARRIWRETLAYYRRFVDEAPDIGGKANRMSSNLYMALAVFAFYEADGRKLTPEKLRALMTERMPKHIPLFSALVDFNKPRNQRKLRARYEKYKATSDEKLDRGEWGNSWRIEMNPRGREKGIAFDLVSCPLADFARKHGYTEIMPVLCDFDYLTASLIHAHLFREHTVATGSPYCDYWYLGDKEQK